MLLRGSARRLVRWLDGSRRPAAARQPALRGWSGPAPRGAAGRERRLAAALDAAGHGERERARDQVSSLLADDPFDADANFVDGLISLEAGRPAEAVAALRRAIYADGGFGLAAFTLGRAYDALGDDGAARRCYELALRTLDPRDSRHCQLLQQLHIGDIAGACRARLSLDPG
jgi:tetratricopeptide (TPR) repeat protein